MAQFLGQLRSNEIFSALYNMIISQEVFADNLGKHQTLVEKARVDGSLYGDTKLYYSTDVLKSAPWGNDAEALNLLALHRPEAPECQAIHLDIFRQISLTVDNYLSKRAWSTEGAFSSFNSIMLGWMRDTKKVYDGTLYNVFIGTNETSLGSQQQTVDVTTAQGSVTDPEELARIEAVTIAQALANLIVEMGDYSREFNDYGNLRSYADESISVIWNSSYINKIKKVDLPTIFHKEGLVDKFEQEVLPSRYFGRSVASGDKGSGKVINASGQYDPTKGVLRSRVEKDIIRTVGGVAKAVAHVFPGDEINAGDTTLTITVGSSSDFAEAEVYVPDATIICKVIAGKLPPYMSAFEVGTSFFNPKSLTENHYLTFGHNTLEHLSNYPFVTVRKV